MPVKVASSYRDRTIEFASVAEKLKKSSPSLASPPNAPNGGSIAGGVGPVGGDLISSAQPPTRIASPIQSEFNKKAGRITLGIHQTSQKLSKLAKLAKKKSVFDDPTVEIQELTAVIKQDITALNSAIVDLQLLSDSQNGGHLSSDSSAHLTTVVDNLKSSLMNTTKEFKEILTMRNENLRSHESRKQLFSSSASTDSNPFIRQRPLATRTAASAAISPPPWVSEAVSQRKTDGGESQPLLQQQSQQQQMVPLQDSYMQSRAGALQSVESTIHELGNIFTQLATMVSQQGELAIRIDENMEDTLSNVEGAQSQLVRYFNSISSNRWLMIKLFIVVIVFLMVFLFFVA
ncbi:OLC1v1037238C1 [Oldenlandia corymbosa var. corymbosa]|uniref:OLC1v1037238C1 n=1 Tax=Oldenlandia corymbosa var. corymbosa TaxID=529605 RepID=A0AAV1CXA3_OLDCO|nr:OLC1v1037238C1 [Oldenlandia corymbosa var. corymbosa]